MPSPMPTHTALEPVAFLNSDMEIVKVSPTFIDALGGANIQGRKLSDIVMPAEKVKVERHQQSMQEDRARNDPMYLPPIYGKQEEERVFNTLWFDAEDLSQIQMDRRDVLVFASQDGQPRSFTVRMGTTKRDSIYFIALLLQLPPGFPYLTPSPQGREPSYSLYTSLPHHQHQQHQQQYRLSYGQPTPLSANFDTGRQRLMETALVPRANPGHPPSTTAGLSPGLSPGPSPVFGTGGMSGPYSASPSRPDFASGPSPSQGPRGDLVSTAQPPSRHASYQLPPIRSPPQHDIPQAEPPVRRDQRSGRVDIEGLIEKPQEPRHSR